MAKGVPQVAFTMDEFRRRRVEIEYQQRHGEGEDSIAERGQPFHAVPAMRL